MSAQLGRWSWVFVLASLGIGACGDDSEKKASGDLGLEPTAKEKAEEATEKTPPAPIDPQTVGTIRGVVRFEGTPPKREKVFMGGYADCLSQHKEAPLSESLIVNDGKLQNVFVYVRKGLEGRKFDVPEEPAVLDQVGCIYIPHMLAVRTGQAVKIKNSDATMHNVRALSNFGQDFNDAMPRKGDVITKKFKKAEVLPLSCSVHPWMNSYVAISSHPYYAITKEDGAFEIAGLPPGKYIIRAWHELQADEKTAAVTMAETPDQEVELGAKETKEISFTFRLK